MGPLIAISVIVFLGWLISRLRKPYVGLGLASLGAVLAGGAALSAGLYYLKFHYAPPRQTHDMDFGGMVTPLLCMIFIPAASAAAGFILGVGFAFWRERALSAAASSKSEGLGR
jgi:peptidoglycan biosynthesis protein MviN/MurJ (putative lipid II flippase)